MKIRTIKPRFWDDELIGQLSAQDRLIFIGLICLADDEGRLVGNNNFIKSKLFTYDDHITKEHIEISITNLHKLQRIRVYGNDQQTYIEVTNFNKHQYIKRPQKSMIPPCSSKYPEKNTKNIQQTLDDLSNHSNSREIPPPVGHEAVTRRSRGGREGKGREGNIVLTYSSQLQQKSDLTEKETIDMIFTTWKKAFNKSNHNKLNDKRKKAIKRMLKTWSVDDLLQSINGYASDTWRQQDSVRNELSTLLRDDVHVEAGLDKLKQSLVGSNPTSYQSLGY